MKPKIVCVDKVAHAIEADLRESLPGLRKSLKQAKQAQFAAVYTPEAIAGHQRNRPAGIIKVDGKSP